MLSRNQIKYIQSLELKKTREQEQLFVAEGEKLVDELLQAGGWIKEIYALENYLATRSGLTGNMEVYSIKQAELERISLLKTPNQVLAVCKIPSDNFNWELLKGKLSLVLDDIRDPGNLGTIIRIADWFGIEYILCTDQTVDAFNPKVVQSTMGSIARVKVHYIKKLELIEGLRELKKEHIPIYGALLDGENMYQSKLASEAVLVIGSESHGISPELISELSHRIKIPLYGASWKSATAESLNAAVATAIIVAEWKRGTYA
jgi:RNA methyltransferase, TrmH family